LERHKKSEKNVRAIKRKGKSAGRGNFVPFTGSSNPRVLSDMALAILMKKTLKISYNYK